MSKDKTYVTDTPIGKFTSNVDPNTDFAKLGKSGASIDSQLRAAGKGDNRRQADVSELTVGQRWCQTFGHMMRRGVCQNGCGYKGK